MNLKFVKKVLLVMMSAFMLVASVPVSAMAMDESLSSCYDEENLNEKLDKYFNYVDSLGKQRILIVGEGRANSKTYKDDSLYFFVDYNPKVRPDYRCDVENMFDLWFLGENQWDVVVLESLPINIYLNGCGINNSFMLLRKGGCITFILSLDFIEIYYYSDWRIHDEGWDKGFRMGLWRVSDAYMAFKMFIEDRKNTGDFLARAFNFDTESYNPTEYSAELIRYSDKESYDVYPKIPNKPSMYEKEFIVKINKL